VSPEESAASAPPGEADPLVSNGLGSPTCARGAGSELPALARSDCETSGFLAAPAPTGNYGLDVHIDTGVLGVSSGGLMSVVQDLFVTPLWMALVWASHALIVMLEWSFTLDFLPGASSTGLGEGLRQMERSLTVVWLPFSLAVASGIVAYQGLVRRRVAETIGDALVMLAMMTAGLWVIADPSGTVGSLSSLSSRAALGTFAVAVSGAPERPEASFASSMEGLVAAVIEAPWCYLEFGDVDWCRNPTRLDPTLRAAGLRIAAARHAALACSRHSANPTPCVGAGSGPELALARSARLLGQARTNGALFLALPANGPERNSINEQGSLLRTLCQGDSLSSCQGPTAAVAEFRSSGATWSRVGGVLLIAAGMLGMLLLLGFVALRLLSAAIFSLLCLLLTPAMVLAPAFGETGRSLFRRWATQLLSAILAKLLFSFLLGVLLALLGVLASLEALGWWTQWLLMSSMWWGAFGRRHHAIGLTAGERGSARRSFATRVGSALRPSVRAVQGSREQRREQKGRAESATARTAASETGRSPSEGLTAPQAKRGAWQADDVVEVGRRRQLEFGRD
jgi:hypothetical protein